MRIYAVWVPSLETDDEDKVPAATTKLADPRVSHYWDSEGKLKLAYQRITKIDEPAWDVYYVYGREAEWKNDPPVPDYWMHQLRGLPPELLLDGAKLAEEINKLLLRKK